MNHAGETIPVGFPVDSTQGLRVAWNLRSARTLAIVGSHPLGLNLVPWDDPNVEIWVFNEAPMKPEKYPRWDACLQIHGPEVYATPHNWVNPGYWDWLQQRRGKPIYMQAVDPRVPDSVEYPLEGVLSMIPYRYLRSSPAMALALAIYKGYEHIQLYGSELTSNTEYAYQANNYAFWIGFAHGRGIDLQLRCWLSEFNQEIYGYDGELQIDRSFYQERITEHERAYQTNDLALKKIKARIDQAMLENKYDHVGELSLQADDIAMVTGEAYGALSEAKRYYAKDSMVSRQEFERTSAKAQQSGDEIRSKKDHAGGKVEYVWNVWKMTGRLEALNQLRVFLDEKLQLAQDTGAQLGTYRENMLYMLEYDKRLTAAGGIRALGRQTA